MNPSKPERAPESVRRSAHRLDAKLIDIRSAAIALGVGIPTSAALFVVLRPWASALEPADFSTAESLAISPAIAMVLGVLWIAYRPLLRTRIVERRCRREVEISKTPLGLLVQSSPLVAGLFAPLFGAGMLVPTAIVGFSVAAVEVALLERQRRGAMMRSLVWSDPALEAYRLRWLVAVIAAFVAAAFVALGVTPNNEARVAGITAFALPLVALSPLWVAVAALSEDDAVAWGTRVRGLAAAALMLFAPLGAQMVWDSDAASAAAAVLGTAVLLPLVENARRMALSEHVEHLVGKGHGEDIRRSYPSVSVGSLPV